MNQLLGEVMNEVGTVAAPAEQEPVVRTEKEKSAALRRMLVRQLFLELALPLGGYYLLRGFGFGQVVSLVAATAFAVPAVIYTIITQKRVGLTVLFSLSIVLLGAAVTLITGDPRLLLVRDAWLTTVLGLWMLGTLLTSKPFMLVQARAIVIAKLGAKGADAWEARWDVEPDFRHHIRFMTAVWGLGFTLDAVVRVVLAYTLPIDAVPLISTVQWLVVLGGIISFHVWYITKHGLKA